MPPELRGVLPLHRLALPGLLHGKRLLHHGMLLLPVRGPLLLKLCLLMPQQRVYLRMLGGGRMTIGHLRPDGVRAGALTVPVCILGFLALQGAPVHAGLRQRLLHIRQPALRRVLHLLVSKLRNTLRGGDGL